MVFVGIDWSERHHDVEVLGESGRRLARLRVEHGVTGLARLQAVIAELTEAEPEQVAVGVESEHGLLVNTLVAAGYAVYPINPKLSAARRESESMTGAKSDRGDAQMLAHMVRTDRHKLRQLAGDSELGQEVRARARAHLRALRTLLRLRNQLRNLLVEFYPAVVPLLSEADIRDALAVLAVAPNPTLSRRLSLNKLSASLRRHGRQRGVEKRAQELQQMLRAPQLELSNPRLVSALSDEVASTTRLLLTLQAELADLEAKLATAFRLHPDAEIYLSFPGLADILGARVLGELGDDPARYPDAKSRRRYAGNRPVTKKSGLRGTVVRRLARNRRLADATHHWAHSAAFSSPGGNAYYRRLKARGMLHNHALRVVANRLVGMLHACLRERRLYDEATAWPEIATPAVAA